MGASDLEDQVSDSTKKVSLVRKSIKQLDKALNDAATIPRIGPRVKGTKSPVSFQGGR